MQRDKSRLAFHNTSTDNDINELLKYYLIDGQFAKQSCQYLFIFMQQCARFLVLARPIRELLYPINVKISVLIEYFAPYIYRLYVLFSWGSSMMIQVTHTQTQWSLIFTNYFYGWCPMDYDIVQMSHCHYRHISQQQTVAYPSSQDQPLFR